MLTLTMTFLPADALSTVHTSDNVAKNGDIVAETGDIVAETGNIVFGHNVAIFGDIVAGVDGALDASAA